MSAFVVVDVRQYFLLFLFYRLESIGTNSAGWQPVESLSGFNRIRDEDSWIGCRVRKKFWLHSRNKRKANFFLGTVTGTDEDRDNSGHRLFEIRYDDGDVAWISAEETHDILYNQNVQVLTTPRKPM